MNTNILTKCIEQLKSDKPDLSYVRGMLETLVEMQDTSPAKVSNPLAHAVPAPNKPSVVADEASILDAQAKAAMGKVVKGQVEWASTKL